MRAVAQKQSQPQPMRFGPARLRQETNDLRRRDQSAFDPQRAKGKRAEASDADPTIAASLGFAHDFSRIPLRPLATGAVQAKLAINTPGDEYEQEADRIAEHVMRAAEPRLQRQCACGASCPACKAEPHGDKRERLQPKRVESNVQGQTTAPAIVHEALGSHGQPLDSGVRTFMESRFGHDFSRVRVHTDERAAASAGAISAHAYTVGHDIVFARGAFDSHSTEGRRLLAHELTHVVQQSAGHASSTAARQAAGVVQRKGCDTGCAQRWGQDTTCSFFGRIEPTPAAAMTPPGEEEKQKPLICCNSWPLSLEVGAIQNGLKGAASCSGAHAGEVATVTYGGKSAEVLCTDTIVPAQFKPKSIKSPDACSDETMNKDRVGGKKAEIIEISPNAMKFLSGRLDRALPVSVCYSGPKPDDLCKHSGPLPANPKIEDCLSEGCRYPENPPTHATSGWPKQ
jgi:hypothetical protein